MNILQVLQSTQLPAAYKAFKEPVQVPFLVYLGAGQELTFADTTIYYKTDLYQVEYYFKDKNPAVEETIEAALIGDHWTYSKSEDVPIDDEGTMVIYYDVWRLNNVSN